MTVRLLSTYRLELFGPAPLEDTLPSALTVTAIGLSPRYLKELTENINDILPTGYSVRIRPAPPEVVGR